MLTVLVNGKFNSQVSALDRGLLYGQTVFETIAVVNARPRLLGEHLNRLAIGCEKLGISIDFNELEFEINLILDSQTKLKNSVLRVTVTMGEGGRGYQNPIETTNTRVLSLHDYPAYPEEYLQTGVKLGLSDVRLSQQPLLAGIKHGNRLEQVLARSTWQKDWQEAVLLNQSEQVVECTQSNLIILNRQQVMTPVLDGCGVDGVMKNWALKQLQEAGFSCQAVRLSIQDLIEADAVIITNSIIGVWPVNCFQSRDYTDFSTAKMLITRLQEDEIIPCH